MSLDKAEQALDIFQKQYNSQVIFYGPPGTSKTYTSTILAALTLDMKWDSTDRFWTKNNNTNPTLDQAQDYLNKVGTDRFALVQFHPSYTYEDFIRGIKVDTNTNNQVTYEVVNKVFGEIAKNAQENFDDANKETVPYVLIIDEINRAPLASVLGELIYGLEYRGNAFSTPYTIKNGTNQLVVPPNLFIIGTMNTADRSIGAMDYAVRRRFAFLSLPSEPQVIIDSWKNSNNNDILNFGKSICAIKDKSDENEEKTDGDTETTEKAREYTGLYADVRALFDPKNMADPSIDREDIMLGHTYFLYDPKVDDAKAYMNYRLEYQIKPILKEYVKDGLLDGKVSKGIDELTLDSKNNHLN